MTNRTQQIFKQFMKMKFSHVEINDPYYKEWEKRFEEGMEWQKSDYSNRFILKTIAPDIYPDDEDKFFIRE